MKVTKFNVWYCPPMGEEEFGSYVLSFPERGGLIAIPVNLWEEIKLRVKEVEDATTRPDKKGS